MTLFIHFLRSLRSFYLGEIMANKQRLDVVVHERFPQYSRRQIQSWIMQGKVTVEGKVCNKAGVQVADEAVIVLDAHEPKFVGRAGFKLEGALDHFGVDVTDFIVLDAGLSTGGFTDCLLQRGAKKVYGVDVGYGQVHEKIRNDSRVVVMERTNLRELKSVGEVVDLVTLDLSFISILKVMDAVNAVLKQQGQLITLIKPQFEAERRNVGRGGIVSDPAVHQAVIERVTKGIIAHGFELIGITESPIEGATGNKEFLAYFRKK
jgi:23S rRNA (cytidine1920-2'-O)/16S rRNA (cytidine1409-2'-O)-methyltransferase